MSTQTDLKTLQCGSCGVWHAIPTKMYNNCLEEGGYWQCPNGHTRGFQEGKHEKEDLRRERDRLKQQLAQKDDEILEERRKAAAHMGEATKLRTRAKHGVCPCCNRTFAKLAMHMKSKHPDFDSKIVPIGTAKTAS